MATPDFGRSVNPISTRVWGRLCPPNNNGIARFSDLPTALYVVHIINILSLKQSINHNLTSQHARLCFTTGGPYNSDAKSYVSIILGCDIK